MSVEPDRQETFDQHVGASIRALRREAGMTMQELATASGLSQPFLSQVERALARPSMRSLDQIAAALGTTVVHLLGDPRHDNTELEVARAGTHVLYREGDDGERVAVRVLSDAPYLSQALEVTGWTAPAAEPLVRRTELTVYVVYGEIDVVTNGKTIRLGGGDAICVPRGVPCTWHNSGPQEARVVTITPSTP